MRLRWGTGGHHTRNRLVRQAAYRTYFNLPDTLRACCPNPRTARRPGSQHVETPKLLEFTKALPPATTSGVRFFALGNTPLRLLRFACDWEWRSFKQSAGGKFWPSLGRIGPPPKHQDLARARS